MTSCLAARKGLALAGWEQHHLKSHWGEWLSQSTWSILAVVTWLERLRGTSLPPQANTFPGMLHDACPQRGHACGWLINFRWPVAAQRVGHAWSQRDMAVSQGDVCSELHRWWWLVGARTPWASDTAQNHLFTFRHEEWHKPHPAHVWSLSSYSPMTAECRSQSEHPSAFYHRSIITTKCSGFISIVKNAHSHWRIFLCTLV